jgi:hypothetical protein
MNTRRFRSPLLVPALLALASFHAAGCAQQVGDIDRTQPNRIARTALEGHEWYMQQTVVGVNATAITSFVGLEGQTERITWGFEEDYLVAYRTHEDVIGIDTLGGQEFEHGRPVAAFPVEYFDVQRQYNSSTGEQTNVIVENGSDRRWFERDFLRVNWTTNQISTGVNPMVDIEGAQLLQIDISAQDQGAEPTWFVETNAEGEVVYIDVLNTYVIEPDYVECVLTFGLPLWGGECGPETIQVRTSIARIEAPSESYFASRPYDDFEANDFGFFPTFRAVYDDRYGATDSGRIQLANIQRIWEDGIDDDGDVIPYAERTPRPIVYYLSPDFPEAITQTMFDIAQDYDSALRRIVAVHQGIEIPNLPEDTPTELSYDEVPRMFYLCENPGSATEGHPVSQEGYRLGHCQREGQEKAIGDIRYSYMVWIPQLQLDGPLGYGPSSVDAITGEIFSARAYIYGEAVDTYAQYALDLIKIMNGELTAEDYGYGVAVQDYFDRLREQADGDLYFGRYVERAEYAQNLREDMIERVSQPRVAEILSRPISEFQLRSYEDAHPLDRYRGTPFERMAIFPEMMNRLSNGALLPDPETNETPAVDDEWVSRLSIASIGDPRRILEQENMRMDAFFSHGPERDCVMRAEVLDPSLIGLAREMAEQRESLRGQGMSTEEIDEVQWNDIRNRLLRFVMAHEVGHNFGLFHNFEASFDALNYRPEYWDLRAETFDTCDPERVTFSADGFFTGQVAPTRCDENGEEIPETAAQYEQRSANLMERLLEGNIRSYQFSSVMDYTPRYFNNSAGLGRYDYAALAYGYGELREVFAQAPRQITVDVRFDANGDVSSTDVRTSRLEMQSFDDVDEYIIQFNGRTQGDQPGFTQDERVRGQDNALNYYHYSVIPMMFQGDVEAMYDRRLVPESEVGLSVVVPYRFCSDFYRDGSIECNVFDQGADYLEVFQDLEDSWDGYYFLTFFRRERPGFGLWMYPFLSRMLTRTMAPMTNLYQHWLLRAADRGPEWYTSDWGGGSATTAAAAAVDFLFHVVTQPTVGTYYFDEEEGAYLNNHEDLGQRLSFLDEGEENVDPDRDYIEISADLGRYGFEQYRRSDDVREELGHFAIFQPEILSWFWAKWAALMAMVDPVVDVVGSDTSSDFNAFSIPIFLVFEDEMATFFGALPREDYSVIGGCAQVDEQGRLVEFGQRNLVSDPPRACNGGVPVNPYSERYGNGDFNMRLLSILYGAGYFQTNYDMEWFDRSTVHILGRNYEPNVPAGYTLETFEEDNGNIYGSIVPDSLTEEEVMGWPGVQMIRRAHALRDAREAVRDPNVERNGQSAEFFRIDNELSSLVEMMRLVNQANRLFDGYNVFDPGLL